MRAEEDAQVQAEDDGGRLIVLAARQGRRTASASSAATRRSTGCDNVRGGRTDDHHRSHFGSTTSACHRLTYDLAAWLAWSAWSAWSRLVRLTRTRLMRCRVARLGGTTVLKQKTDQCLHVLVMGTVDDVSPL